MAIAVGALFLDPVTGHANFDGVSAELTAQETALLSFLMETSPNFSSADKLLKEVWGRTWYTGCNSLVRTNVCQIRRKLGADCIWTKRGFGYRVLA